MMSMRTELNELRDLPKTLLKSSSEEAKIANAMMERAVEALEKNLRCEFEQAERAKEEQQKLEYSQKEAKLRQEIDDFEQKYRGSEKQRELLQKYYEESEEEADMLTEKLKKVEQVLAYIQFRDLGTRLLKKWKNFEILQELRNKRLKSIYEKKNDTELFIIVEARR